MLHHVSIGVSDIARAGEFYDAVLGALGYGRVFEFLPYGIGYGDGHPQFWVQLPRGQQELTVANGAHIAIAAPSTESIAAFHAIAVKNGAIDDGAPGPRPEYSPDYYAAFIIDPFGNRIEAVLRPQAAAAPKKTPAKKSSAKKAVKVSAKKAPKKNAAKAAKAVKAKAAKPVKKTAVKKVVKKIIKKASVKKAVAKAAPKKIATKKTAPKKSVAPKVAPKKVDKKVEKKGGKKHGKGKK